MGGFLMAHPFLSFRSTAEPLVQINGKPSCCFFKFSPKLMFTKVLKAQLWVYLRPLQQTSTVYLQILRLKPVTEQGSRHIRIRSLKIELNSRVGHWQSIDFKHVLQNWFKQPHTNWGIDINAFDESGNDLAVTSLRPGEEGLVRILRPVLGVGERKQHSSRLCTPCFSQIQRLLRKSGGVGVSSGNERPQDSQGLNNHTAVVLFFHYVGKTVTVQNIFKMLTR